MAQFDYQCKACSTKFSIHIGFFNRPPVRDIICPVCKQYHVEEVPFWQQMKEKNKENKKG